MSEEGGDGESVYSETSSLLSYTLRYVSFTVVVSVCRVALREPMDLCTFVNEEGDGFRYRFSSEGASWNLVFDKMSVSVLIFTSHFLDS